MRIVAALGGNALAPEGDASIEAQREQIEATAAELATLHDAGHDLVLTHGNGPQVGALLSQQEAGNAPARPLDVLVAETQAQIGYLVQQALDERVDNRVASVVTQVRVDPEDPAFDDPEKPVGPYLDAAAARERDVATAEVTTPEGETAYRRVVASPEPLAVLERGRIRSLVEGGGPVVCAGGGGVPVVVEPDHDGNGGNRGDGRNNGTGGNNGTGENNGTDRNRIGGSRGDIEGVPAVVDKDATTELVASDVDADVLVMATDVPYAYTGFGTADQSPIETATPSEMRAYLDQGEFPAGSMQPKIEACLDFLDAGGQRAVVTSTDGVVAAVEGTAGTQIRPAGEKA